MVALSGQMLADRATEQIIDTFYPVGYDSDANLMISQMKQRGIEYTVNDEASQSNPAQHFKFVNDDAKALASEIVGLLQAKKLITKGSIGTNPSKYYEKEQCVMSISSTGGSSYNISSNFVVKIAPVPYSGSRPYYIQQGPSICFFNNDNDYIHKGAWLFYKYIANVAYNTGLSLENSYDPIRKSCYETAEYAQWIAHPTGSGLKYDVPKITKTLTDYYMTSPVFIGSGTARDEIGSIISYIYNGEAVDSAFARAYNKCVAAA